MGRLPGVTPVQKFNSRQTYRAIVRKYLPRAQIVADRFHVIRPINQHFLACWREIDPDPIQCAGCSVRPRTASTAAFSCNGENGFAKQVEPLPFFNEARTEAWAVT
jgi:hypothetical protein